MPAGIQDLMSQFNGVNSGAWQACGATLALVGEDPAFAEYTFNELQTLFRCQPHASIVLFLHPPERTSPQMHLLQHAMQAPCMIGQHSGRSSSLFATLHSSHLLQHSTDGNNRQSCP